jgi:hypothetical protein
MRKLANKCFGCPLVARLMAANVLTDAKKLAREVPGDSEKGVRALLADRDVWDRACVEFQSVAEGSGGLNLEVLDYHIHRVADVYGALVDFLFSQSTRQVAHALRAALRVLRLFPSATHIPEDAVRAAWMVIARAEDIPVSLFDRVRYILQRAAVIEAWRAPVLYPEQGVSTGDNRGCEPVATRRLIPYIVCDTLY